MSITFLKCRLLTPESNRSPCHSKLRFILNWTDPTRAVQYAYRLFKANRGTGHTVN